MNGSSRSRGAGRIWRALGGVLVLALALLLLALAALPSGRRWLHQVDSGRLGERVMDSLTLLRTASPSELQVKTSAHLQIDLWAPNCIIQLCHY